jgi:hypothetical protein
MGEDKEALERLKARAAKEELAAGNVQGPNCRGTEWGADIIAAHRQHAADLSWIIAEREGLEREVEELREALEDISAYPGPHADEAAHWRAERASQALAALQSHKGGEGDSELAAADNNDKADCTTSGGAG